MKPFTTEVERMKNINDEMKMLCFEMYRILYNTEATDELISQLGRTPVSESLQRFSRRGVNT